MKSLSIVRIGMTAFLLHSVLACTGPQSPSTPSEHSADLISDRPIGIVPEMFVVTLNSPALLKTAKRTADGGWEIPPEAKAAVQEEQAQFEQKLKSLAPQAQIVYRYQLVLNGFALYAPSDSAKRLSKITGVRSVEPSRRMERPLFNDLKPAPKLSSLTNSVNFIGADKVHKLGFTGRGISVGVLDTGIDYTHAMLGGSGNPEDFKSIHPEAMTEHFPNAKVVGGIDLVGTEFNAGSPFAERHLPKPDANPIDEAGHGTHVAGTIAGIGDGRQTYSGVAPDAVVHAIKVFGREGSTMDAVVIAGFEYAADPSGDLDISDRLDVVNLSLGGGFGQPQILYSEAVKNLTRTGTVVVASAGNSGPVDFIVGAPSTTDEAISVAASVDGSAHNWQFPAVLFTGADGEQFMAKAVEGSISKPISEVDATEGALVYVGLADQDFSEELKAKLKNKVALIMRGKVTFVEKLARAQGAGAIGVVMINNEPGDRAFQMGGEFKFDIPAVMIGNDLGAKLIEDLKNGEVRIEFKTSHQIFEPELIDTITDFSSKGPRSEDNLLKPEIAAPGQSIISAAIGEGTAGVQSSGTSMAAPHMAGVMALLRQAHPQLSVADLKSLVMGSSKVLMKDSTPIPMTLQGAGRVRADVALKTPVVISPSALSLGRVQVGTSRKLNRSVTLKNLTNSILALSTNTVSSGGLKITLPGEVVIPPRAEIVLNVEAEVNALSQGSYAAEFEARVLFSTKDGVVAQLPALAIATQAAQIRSQGLAGDAVLLTNSSPAAGFAVPFNLLAEDPPKPLPAPNEAWKSRSCDLRSAGYRIIKQTTDDGEKEFLQIAFKLHQPVTTWIFCEVTALIDADEDGQADQEFAGILGSNLAGFNQGVFASVLVDAPKMRELRLAYEQELAQGNETQLNYQPALLAVSDMAPFPHSTLAVIQTPLEQVAKTADGSIRLKLVALGSGGEMIEADDYLGNEDWLKIPGQASGQAYAELPEVVQVNGFSQSGFNFKRGSGQEKLVIYYPTNDFMSGLDTQQIF